MSLTLELTAEEEAQLRVKARRAGLAPEDLLKRYIAADDGIYDPYADPNFSDEWSEEDLRDATAASFRLADVRLGTEDET